jgi:hypothetical protein
MYWRKWLRKDITNLERMNLAEFVSLIINPPGMWMQKRRAGTRQGVMARGWRPNSCAKTCQGTEKLKDQM